MVVVNIRTFDPTTGDIEIEEDELSKSCSRWTELSWTECMRMYCTYPGMYMSQQHYYVMRQKHVGIIERNNISLGGLVLRSMNFFEKWIGILFTSLAELTTPILMDLRVLKSLPLYLTGDK